MTEEIDRETYNAEWDARKALAISAGNDRLPRLYVEEEPAGCNGNQFEIEHNGRWFTVTVTAIEGKP